MLAKGCGNIERRRGVGELADDGPIMLALAGHRSSGGISGASTHMRRVLHDWDADFLLEKRPS